MKALKMLVLIVTITLSSAVSASTNPNREFEPTTVSETVGELLKSPKFKLKKDVNAMVSIYVNENDEIVVLSVDTNNKDVELYIKNRLNYKRISKDVYGYNKSFKIPVKILKST